MPSGSSSRLPPVMADAPLLVWLLEALRPMSRTRVKELLQHGRIHVNGISATQFDHPLKPGDRVEIGTPRLKANPQLIPIAYQDESVIVVDKPAGLLSVATDAERIDTAFVRLRIFLEHRQAGRPFVVHRLDRDTSGLLLFARSSEIRDRLQANWDAVEKTYLAVVEGTPRESEGTIRNFLLEGRDLRVRAVGPGGEAREAVSKYRVVNSRGECSLVEVGLLTGRKHQIRVHLAGLGHPVSGDKLYGARTNPARRLALHAWQLTFAHPVTGARITVESPLPKELRKVV